MIGKHAAGVVERALIGNAALRILDLASCDVLVVPKKVNSPSVEAAASSVAVGTRPVERRELD